MSAHSSPLSVPGTRKEGGPSEEPPGKHLKKQTKPPEQSHTWSTKCSQLLTCIKLWCVFIKWIGWGWILFKNSTMAPKVFCLFIWASIVRHEKHQDNVLGQVLKGTREVRVYRRKGPSGSSLLAGCMLGSKLQNLSGPSFSSTKKRKSCPDHVSGCWGSNKGICSVKFTTGWAVFVKSKV